MYRRIYYNSHILSFRVLWMHIKEYKNGGIMMGQRSMSKPFNAFWCRKLFPTTFPCDVCVYIYSKMYSCIAARDWPLADWLNPFFFFYLRGPSSKKGGLWHCPSRVIVMHYSSFHDHQNLYKRHHYVLSLWGAIFFFLFRWSPSIGLALLCVFLARPQV